MEEQVEKPKASRLSIGVFIFSLIIVLINLTFLIFPSLFPTLSGSGVDVNPFEAGAWAMWVIPINLFLLGFGILFYKKILPKKIRNALNFILNNYDTKKPFSEVVQEAKDAGLTEPDPLIDLSGVDVMRKILILAREAGYKLEMADVRIDSLLPSGFQPGNTDQLFNELMKHEDHFEALFRKANKIGKKLKFVAYFDNGKAGAGLKEISPNSIFYGIDGKDNIVSITTERYREQPLVIRGPGAGAEVTASGIFSDIMRIVNQV